jgi:hypothetical protein
MSKQKEAFIPKSKSQVKRLRAMKKEEEIPKDLADIWSAVVAVSTAHNLLQNGHFTYAHRNAVGVSIAFLEELHAKALEDAVNHPKQHLIPEIAKLNEENQKVKNGQTTADQKQ